MDLLSTRYANPFFILDGVISTGRLYEFIRTLDNIRVKEKEAEEEQRLWKFWLLHAADKTFKEFKRELVERAKPETAESIAKIINNTKNMMNGFIPGEEVAHEII